jgi:hypothetical protein
VSVGLKQSTRRIDTGRGKRGDQRLEGANRDLAENRYTNYIFEGGVGSERLRFLGTAVATRQWRARGLDEDGNNRQILRYRLQFATGGSTASSPAQTRPATAPRRTRSRTPAQQQRQRRRFDPSRSPKQYRTPVQQPELSSGLGRFGLACSRSQVGPKYLPVRDAESAPVPGLGGWPGLAGIANAKSCLRAARPLADAGF